MSFLEEKEYHPIMVGVSYKNADEYVRGNFSLQKQNILSIINEAKALKIEELFIISTCNRTELYAVNTSADLLIRLLTNHSKGTASTFHKLGYIKKANEVITHLFRVGIGLDSQILGDFEVIGQIKKAYSFHSKEKSIGVYFDRLINSVIKTSKITKTKTKISTGAASITYATTQYIIKSIPDIYKKNILLFGTGKIGHNTCKNLLKHTQNITLINRTDEKAKKIGESLELTFKKYEELKEAITSSDILIVATDADEPVINKNHLPTNKKLLIIDLSVPSNVNKDVKEDTNHTYISLDTLSKLKDETLDIRKENIPVVEDIIAEEIEEFSQWITYNRKYAGVLDAFKNQLLQNQLDKITIGRRNKHLHKETNVSTEIATLFSQKITNQIALFLKENPSKASESLHLIREIFQLK